MKPAPAPRAAAAAPRPAANGSAVDLPSAGLGPGGDGTPGLVNFGASVSGFDADFPFAYYAEQLQALIGANWLKPDVPPGTACVVTFRIQRSGQVTDVEVETPSGIGFYDRAASRSVYSRQPSPAPSAGVPPGRAGGSHPLPVKHSRRSAMRLAPLRDEPRSRRRARPALGAAARPRPRPPPRSPPTSPSS